MVRSSMVSALNSHPPLKAEGPSTRGCALSIIIPLYNEAANIPRICARIAEVLAGAPAPYSAAYEVLLVDDGSSDSSFEACTEAHRRNPRVRVVQFRRNFGKTAALQAGFQLARGDRVVTIDADMQEDPADLFRLMEPLDAGYDLVSAWRHERNDPVSKTLPSRVFNAVVATITGVHLHDFNCGFKAYSGELARSLRLYGELHRFIPVLAHQQGFRVTEVPVAHQPRLHGKSKFGARRLGRGYLDFIQVLFLTTYLRRPLRLFGSLGTLLLLAGGLICTYLSILWFQGQRPIGDRPLLTLGVLLLLSGLQFISTGLVGEMLRYGSYHPGDEYAIRRVLERDPTEV